ncbi:hypothetical protein [Bacillus sp. B-jedd]|uniref:hypothetical protein n=1 Tax=Bacillus sp. B-jedd TaxID=1476857 RepID=UPI0005155569|nr:hypothetical protein [Bacillus sp. B-jedd]CEG28788.1 hypothetical protein BN1002_03711 [Bacillus sp. B-jedd]
MIMEYIFAFLTPIIAIIFFIKCVTIAKKIKKGEDVFHETVLGAIMFGFIIFSIIWSGMMSG